jgi:hypothetical protein
LTTTEKGAAAGTSAILSKDRMRGTASAGAYKRTHVCCK